MIRRIAVLYLALLLCLVTLSACNQSKAQAEKPESIQESKEPTAQTQPNLLYTVTFQDHRGNVIDTQTVKDGEAASAPEYTPEKGYIFVGWNKEFTCITGDTVVKALHTAVRTQSMIVPEKLARPGQSVTVPVVIVHNPGIAGAKLTIVYDPALKLVDAKSGEAFSCLDYTGPGKYQSPCSFTWDSESGMAVGDGQLLLLIFQIPPDAPVGKTYAVNCVYTDGDIFDEGLNDVSLTIINGAITVE